jgi:hypothetical protein
MVRKQDMASDIKELASVTLARAWLKNGIRVITYRREK